MNPEKSELPLASETEVSGAVARFEACTLPNQHWTHRAHLAVAVVYARRYPYITALNRLRQHINAYNCCCGDPAGYHETVTVLFMKKICLEATSAHCCAALHEEVARISSLCTVPWLYRYYSKPYLWSDAARHQYLPPDLQPLDF